MEETSIKLQGNFSRSLYGALLKSSLERALEINHKLTDVVLNMTGMSGRKYRSLINTLVKGVPAPKYLEVGSWAGSTASAVLWKNAVDVVCIDNWSQFGGPKDAFLENTALAGNENTRLMLVESDFRAVPWGTLPKSNIYMFDGPHTEVDQYDGIVIAQPALEDTYILVVDDYNWPSVRNGTLRAINDLGLTVECAIEIRTTQDDTHPQIAYQANSDWHNGYFIAVIGKRK
jgi:hypothetical protein